MGIIRAVTGAVGGGLSDSWLEVFEADNMSDATVVTGTVAVRGASKRNQNTKAECEMAVHTALSTYGSDPSNFSVYYHAVNMTDEKLKTWGGNQNGDPDSFFILGGSRGMVVKMGAAYVNTKGLKGKGHAFFQHKDKIP